MAAEKDGLARNRGFRVVTGFEEPPSEFTPYLKASSKPPGWTRAGPRRDARSPFLAPGGVIAPHNSAPRQYVSGHEGHLLIAEEMLKAPDYVERRLAGGAKIARRPRQRRRASAAATRRTNRKISP